MAFKLNKAKQAELQALADAYQQAAEAYSQALADLVSEWEEEFDERSERWQESEAGQEVCDKLDRLQEAADNAAELETIDFDEF